MVTAEFDDDALALLYAAAERLERSPSDVLREQMEKLLISLGIDPADVHT